MGLFFSILKLLLPLANNETLRTMVLTLVMFGASYVLIAKVDLPRGRPDSLAEQVHVNSAAIQELKLQNERVLSSLGKVAEGIESLKADVGENKEATKTLDKRLWEFMLQQRLNPRKASLTF